MALFQYRFFYWTEHKTLALFLGVVHNVETFLCLVEVKHVTYSQPMERGIHGQ